MNTKHGVKIAILGAGNMGTALAHHLSTSAAQVQLWDTFAEVVDDINQTQRNSRYLPDVSLAANVTAVYSANECIQNARLVILALPSAFISQTLEKILPDLDPDAVILNVAKGVEPSTGKPIHHQIIHLVNERPVALLAGPAIANEFSRGLPTAVLLATRTSNEAAWLRSLFERATFRISTTFDIEGAALGGLLKNVYAILLGVIDTAGKDTRNLEAAALTAALDEMARLGEAMNAQRETFFGLAGLGDLVATGFSKDSHNRNFGKRLGLGQTITAIKTELRLLPEGAHTVATVCHWSKQYEIQTPLASFVNQLVNDEAPPLSQLYAHLG